MHFTLGNVAAGSNLFPRDAFVARLLGRLQAGNVSFVGPRRTGKSSVLRALRDRPPKEYVPILLDLQRFGTPAQWLEHLIERTLEVLRPEHAGFRKWKDRLGGLLERIEKFKGPAGIEVQLAPGEPRWIRQFDLFLALLRESEVPILFLFDEFPYFLDHVVQRSAEEAAAVLQWFRAARIDLAGSRVRFVVTGSIGLEAYLHRLGLSREINDLDVLEIPALTAEEANEMIARLAEGERIALDPGASERIQHVLGVNWPYHLQLILSELKEAPAGETGEPVEAAYRRLLHGNRDQYCKEMRDRLSPTRQNDHVPIFNATESTLARAILRECAGSAPGLSSAEIRAIHERLVSPEVRAQLPHEFTNVLETLRHDGYLAEAPSAAGRWRFASNLLRDFWRHHDL